MSYIQSHGLVSYLLIPLLQGFYHDGTKILMDSDCKNLQSSSKNTMGLNLFVQASKIGFVVIRVFNHSFELVLLEKYHWFSTYTMVAVKTDG